MLFWLALLPFGLSNTHNSGLPFGFDTALSSSRCSTSYLRIGIVHTSHLLCSMSTTAEQPDALLCTSYLRIAIVHTSHFLCSVSATAEQPDALLCTVYLHVAIVHTNHFLCSMSTTAEDSIDKEGPLVHQTN